MIQFYLYTFAIESFKSCHRNSILIGLYVFSNKNKMGNMSYDVQVPIVQNSNIECLHLSFNSCRKSIPFTYNSHFRSIRQFFCNPCLESSWYTCWMHKTIRNFQVFEVLEITPNRSNFKTNFPALQCIAKSSLVLNTTQSQILAITFRDGQCFVHWCKWLHQNVRKRCMFMQRLSLYKSAIRQRTSTCGGLARFNSATFKWYFTMWRNGNTYIVIHSAYAQGFVSRPWIK